MTFDQFGPPRVNIAICGKYHFTSRPVVAEPFLGYGSGEPAGFVPVDINWAGLQEMGIDL